METSKAQDKDLVTRTYGKIILTLENALISSDKLDAPTISEVDGLSKEIETDLRILGCELIQSAGILLKLPQVSKANAMIFTVSTSARHIVDFQFSLDVSRHYDNVENFQLNVYKRLLIEKNKNLLIDVIITVLTPFVLGRNGFGTSSLSTLLLLQIICAS